MFAARGYEGTSIREICEAADITRPTLYHFYGSKEGVYRALVRNAFEEFNKQIAHRLAQEGTLRERFRCLARAFFADARSRPKLWRFIFTLVWAAPHYPHTDELHSFYYGIVETLAGATEQAVTSGEIVPGDTSLRMLVLMGAIAETLSNNLLNGRPELTPELADALIDTIFAGWTAQA